jgi:hypothetical protein
MDLPYQEDHPDHKLDIEDKVEAEKSKDEKSQDEVLNQDSASLDETIDLD